MALWIVMLITQPFLIKYKKLSLHRKMGRISYVLVPLAWISTFLMMQFSYHAFADMLSGKFANGQPVHSQAEIRHLAAKNTALPFIYFTWMGLFYFLAIFNRKKASVHARYMLASSLSILGPTVDRILFINLKLEKLFWGIPVETVAFFLADLILVLLLIRDYRQKRNTGTMLICLLVFIGVQVLYFIIPNTKIWENFITFILDPGIGKLK